MSQLCTVEAIRQLEAAALAALPEGTLMARAALGLADVAEAMLREIGQRSNGVLAIMAGRGNNGCDAMLAGLVLQQRGFKVVVFADPAATAATLNARLLDACRQQGIALEPFAELPAQLGRSLLVIDGLFGIGQNRPLAGIHSEVVQALNLSAVPVLAVDVPSGLDADTGSIVGRRESADCNAVAVRARRTLTFVADKPGLHTGAALEHAGTVSVETLGLAGTGSAAADSAETGAMTDVRQVIADPENAARAGELYGRNEALRALPRRGINSHKGTFGSVLLAGGSAGMTGAIWLAASGAQAAGAGKVFVSSPVASVVPQLQAQWMSRPWPNAALQASPGEPPGVHMLADIEAWIAGIQAVVFGCGLGRSQAAADLLARLWLLPLPLVIDADGLNLLGESRLRGDDRHPQAVTLLTPHPLEAARLLASPVGHIQNDRRSAAMAIAGRYCAHVVLKGAGSVLAGPDGRWAILNAGAPTLATAGSGDVLAGVLGALLAQGINAWTATRLGAYVHARAGELAQTQLPLGTGMAATELFSTIRLALNGR